MRQVTRSRGSDANGRLKEKFDNEEECRIHGRRLQVLPGMGENRPAVPEWVGRVNACVAPMKDS